ncbi:TetR family transcriptional regulator [Aeromonas simiae]|uniref:TetR family transcriptional regulator n=1 Tax=Aeromonas simiae TaxID=218936 RepID=A0A5J6WUP4_9GAMM|nr:TetR family transcriptional regulator [Aeromonas simiae]QFI53984.1 TetR family transcriptional regulator [Aeromonas simiae]
MARRTKEEAQQTRERIMNTALDLFCRHGLAKTSLSDIAQAADLSRGAIYWHFKNKDELFASLWEELCAPLAQQLYACIDPAEADPLGRLRIFLREALHQVSTAPAHRQMFSLMFSLESMEGETHTLRTHMREQAQQFFRDLEATLNNAKQQGQLPPHTNTARCATLLHCALDGYILNWMHFPERISLEQETDFLLDNLFALLRQTGGMHA